MGIKESSRVWQVVKHSASHTRAHYTHRGGSVWVMRSTWATTAAAIDLFEII